MIHETHCTISEAFELIGRRLHGDVWTGGESSVLSCELNEEDIATRRARAEKAVEPTQVPGDGGPGGASEQIMSLRERARDEQMTLHDIIRVLMFAEMKAETEMEEEINVQLVDSRATSWIKHLQMTANHESLRKLRSGGSLSVADFAILDELEKEHHAVERRESVMHWITRHTWSGDDTEAALTGYIYTPDDGKVTPMPAHYWEAQSFSIFLYSNKATVDDQPWPADGVLVFLKKQLDAVLGTAQPTLPASSTPLEIAAPALPAAIGRPTAKAEIEAAYQDLRGAGKIDFGAPKARLYQPIREKVRGDKESPDLWTGLGDEAIRKAISPLFEQDKNKARASP